MIMGEHCLHLHLPPANIKSSALRKKSNNVSKLLSALKQCRDLEQGRRLHANSIESGDNSNIYVASKLAEMYANCGSMTDAQSVFNGIPETVRDVVLWNVLILGYARNGEPHVALELLFIMQARGCIPNARTYVGALKACTTLAGSEELQEVDGTFIKPDTLKKGMHIHALAAKCGMSDIYDVFVANALIDMYSKCGSLKGTKQVFDCMRCARDVVSWNTLLMGYVENGGSELALKLLEELTCVPDALTFVAGLKACSAVAAKETAINMHGELVKVNALEIGMDIHVHVKVSGWHTQLIVANTLLDMYANCGRMAEAWTLFQSLKHRGVVTWNVMLLGYAENREGEQALHLFMRMQDEGYTPDGWSFVAVLKACATLADVETKMDYLEKAMALHAQVTQMSLRDTYIFSCLIDVYATLGSIWDARYVFDSLQYRGLVAWNSLIMAYVENAEVNLALRLFTCMQVKPDSRTFFALIKACSILAANEECTERDGRFVKSLSLETGMAIHNRALQTPCDSAYIHSSLVDMYAKCGSMSDALQAFNEIPSPSVISWNSLLMGYVENGEETKAVEFYSKMQQSGIAPNARTVSSVLKACEALADLETGKVVLIDTYRSGLYYEPAVVVSFYGKCGSMSHAQLLFDSLDAHDVVMYSVVIDGYGRQGDTQLSISLLGEMLERGLNPNDITFLSVLTSCSRAGLVQQGKHLFDLMVHTYKVVPRIDHYHCMIDLLGRSNQLQEALEMVKNMPFEPDKVTWTTLLSASSKWKNAEIAKLAFEELQLLDDKSGSTYVLMGSVCI